MSTIREFLKDLTVKLLPYSDTARLDAQVLVAHVFATNRAWVLAHPEKTLNSQQERALQNAVKRLEKGDPLPYILGHWEFYGMTFSVSPAVLIPRPETELLVERALDWLQTHPGNRQAIDVGTGSGCIAVAIAANIPNLEVFATDISFQALKLARKNATSHHVADRLNFIQSDLLQAIAHGFHLICANLPYIPTARLESLSVSLNEPRTALDGGPDGLKLIEGLLLQARNVLLPGGLILLEIDDSHGKLALALAQENYPKSNVMVFPDLAGRERILQVQT